jgi:hypothetical protein
MNYFLYFVSYLTSNAPKTMILRFPHAFRLSLLPFILPCIPDAYFWLVVVWKIVDRQPPKAKAPFISIFVVVPFCHPKRWDEAPYRDPTRSRLLFNIPSIASANCQLIVMSCRLTATT